MQLILRGFHEGMAPQKINFACSELAFKIVFIPDFLSINVHPLLYTLCKNTYGVKKMQPMKVESYLEMNA